MGDAERSKLLAVMIVALAAILVISNALWYITYASLSSKYRQTAGALRNVTGELIYVEKLLNTSIQALQDYKNLTALLNITITAMNAEKVAAVTNVSLELDVESIKLMALVAGAISEANQTSDPIAREYLVMLALNATNATMEGLKALAFLGSYMKANSTYFQYIASAEGSVLNIAQIAWELKSPSATVPASSVTSDITNFVSSVLAAERILASLARPQSTS